MWNAIFLVLIAGALEWHKKNKTVIEEEVSVNMKNSILVLCGIVAILSYCIMFSGPFSG